VPPAASAAAPSTLTCEYALAFPTAEPGVLSALASIAQEIPGPAAAGAPAAPLRPAEAAAAPPRRFSFRGSGVTRRGTGDCALLRGAFEPGPPGGPLTTGSLLLPNSTAGAVPPTKAPGVRLCRAETAVKFAARFGGMGERACNLYKVGGRGRPWAGPAGCFAAARVDPLGASRLLG
jgi:hypothetical protein